MGPEAGEGPSLQLPRAWHRAARQLRARSSLLFAPTAWRKGGKGGQMWEAQAPMLAISAAAEEVPPRKATRRQYDRDRDFATAGSEALRSKTFFGAS